LCSFSVVVTSENEPRAVLTITSASGNVNDEVKVSLTVSKYSMISAAELLVNYDPTRLAVISIVNGEVLSTGMGVSNPKFSETKIKAACIHVNGIEKSGSLFEMKFKIKEAAKGSIPLTLEVKALVNKKSMPIAYTIVNGNISVISNGEDSHEDSIISTISQNLLSSNTASDGISRLELTTLSSSKSLEITTSNQSNLTDKDVFDIIGSIKDSKGINLNGYILEIPSLNSSIKINDQGKFTINNVDFKVHVINLKDPKGKMIGALLFVVSHGSKTAISGNGITVNARNIRLDLTLTNNKLKIENVDSINEKENPTLFIIIVLVALLLVLGIYIKCRSKLV
jgi:hypothetical protein